MGEKGDGTYAISPCWQQRRFGTQYHCRKFAVPQPLGKLPQSLVLTPAQYICTYLKAMSDRCLTHLQKTPTLVTFSLKLCQLTAKRLL